MNEPHFQGHFRHANHARCDDHRGDGGRHLP
jgi:hypothetical protein